MTSVHCFYFGLSKILEINEKEKVDQYILFHALGGHQITIFQIENDNYPLMIVRGNKFDYERFRENTGIAISKQFQKDGNLTFNLLNKGKVQLVYANCLYLPYDEKNYQKISDEHMVIIENYIPTEDSFIVTDVEHDKAKIKAGDLKLARREAKYNENMYFSLNRIDKTFDLSTLPTGLKEMIKSNAISFRDQIDVIESQIKDNLEKINECEPLFKKIATKQMWRFFKHPNGIIATRSLMRESLEMYSLYPNDVIKLYGRLNEAWEAFSIDLLRFGKGRILITDMVIKLKEVMGLERKANDLLIIKGES